MENKNRPQRSCPGECALPPEACPCFDGVKSIIWDYLDTLRKGHPKMADKLASQIYFNAEKETILYTAGAQPYSSGWAQDGGPEKQAHRCPKYAADHPARIHLQLAIEILASVRNARRELEKRTTRTGQDTIHVDIPDLTKFVALAQAGQENSGGMMDTAQAALETASQLLQSPPENPWPATKPGAEAQAPLLPPAQTTAKRAAKKNQCHCLRGHGKDVQMDNWELADRCLQVLSKTMQAVEDCAAEKNQLGFLTHTTHALFVLNLAIQDIQEI